MKIVINTDFGGFGLSDQAFEAYLELKGIEYTKQVAEEPSAFHSNVNYYDTKGEYISYYDIARNDPQLVEVVESMGEAAWGVFSNLKVVDVPDDVTWYIHEYDGIECIHEAHRQWS